MRNSAVGFGEALDETATTHSSNEKGKSLQTNETFYGENPSLQPLDVAPDSTLDGQPVITVNELIPIVHCFTVWKICEALDLKAKFVPLPGTTVLPRTPHSGVDQMTAAPVVGSFSVWKICQALDLPAIYDPQLIRTTVFRKLHKPIPVVQSIAVFELCKALNLTVKLAPQ
ncbi:hypothetical protein TNIN_331551 [Trichonephila inaurata madagascariensis]|uniref:Uncharacterized protein n=1 Tax=Trichonephila inaurata madagascariensis TaxID=2747483 RepID=A0A8X6IX84_9ARAC|nr:hypothetical protein TNIN_331551 [Trichonephila inaurata madagascariensis]